MPYSTVLFDLDHTLLDSDASEAAAYRQTMRFAGVDDPESLFEAYRQINLSLWAAVESGSMRADEVRTRRFEEFNETAGIDADPETMAQVFVDSLGSNGELYPGALDMLEEVSAVATLGLVTNGISEVQRARVERLGLERFFAAIVISSEVATSKPGSEIFDIAFERLGGPQRSSAVMVGDSLTSDMAGGHRYGIATCWYNPHRMEPTVDFALDHVVSDLRAVVEVVNG